ncbi:MAG: ABC transporter ATP-binding protein [Rectinemataceae bacterium]|jgi:ABC-type Fe3+/spermidine/putrescine transport system ATPase subunit
MPNLIVKNLTKSFGENKVLSDVSFEVRDGEFLSLLGPSGCGKTTILRIVNGLETPDAGSVLVGDCDITRLPAERRNIGMVFQNYALFPTMTVAKNVGYGLMVRKKPHDEIEERVRGALRLVDLEELGERKVTKLSGGQQQRVALARALVIEPDILLLDEPLSALDRKMRVEMQYEIRNIQQKVGITTVFVTHDQEEALTMSDKIILMNRGLIEQESDPWTLYNHPVSIFASDFLGKANILDAKLVRAGEEWWLEGRGWRFPADYRGGESGDEVKVALRGEHFILGKEPSPGSCPFRIAKKVFTGSICKLVGALGEDAAELASINLDAEDYGAGETIHVKPSRATTLYFPLDKPKQGEGK